jgi:hypothetical protein
MPDFVRSEAFNVLVWDYLVPVCQPGLQWYFRIEIPTGASLAPLRCRTHHVYIQAC